jgi:thiamine-monophosphate kinase
MAKLSDLGEKSVISRLLEIFDPDGLRSMGDDCAILDRGDDYLLVTTDMIYEKTHIPKGSAPGDVGWYAAAINLSDIAAMGGTPLGMLFAFGLPRDTDPEWLDSLVSGIQECCSQHNAPVIGGDTKENDSVTISGTAIGTVRKSQMLRRSGARPGDIVAMTGRLGRGVLWDRDRGNTRFLLRIEPRVKEGLHLASSGAVTSCIDMSDGLSTSLHHLARSGKVGFEVDLDRIPMMDGLDRKGKLKALHSGGDYELLFTVNPKKIADIPGSAGNTPITHIGRVTEKGVTMTVDGKTECLADEGYEHFGKGWS